MHHINRHLFLYFSFYLIVSHLAGCLASKPDPSHGVLHNGDAEHILLHRRIFDDFVRTKTVDCDDGEDDNLSDVSSVGSADSVALSVIIDQDFGLIGITTPPCVSPPPVPFGVLEEVEYKFEDSEPSGTSLTSTQVPPTFTGYQI